MGIHFTKMQGAGNDYVYVNALDKEIENPEKLAIKLSDRNFGIGSDGLVLILPSKICDFKMRMFNSDGSEAEMCGNASRCVGKYVYDYKLTEKTEISLETKAGIKHISLLSGNIKSRQVTVDMGEPILSSKLIPMISEDDMAINLPINIDGQEMKITCVSMGNPHAVIFMKEISNLNLNELGPKFENHKIFPKRTNTEFVEIISRNHLKMRVWERGAGETLACGTGACASLVAGVLNNLCDEKAKIELKGGTLQIEWNRTNNHVYMTGEAVSVFEGTLFD